MIDNHEVIYPCFSAFNFSSNMLVLFFSVLLASAIKRKITLACDVCSRPPITIRSHNLHAGNIRRAVGEIVSYHKRD
jgi:hypothetical protein